MDMTAAAEVRQLARRFVADVFEALSRDRVIPRAQFSPHIRVGHEYFGNAVHPLASFGSLELALEDAFAERFAAKGPGELREFPSTYLFSLIEAAVYRCTVGSGEFDADGSSATDSIDEMLSVLSAPTSEVVVARIVTHMTTTTGGRLELGDAVIEPGGGWDGLRLIGSLIPGTGGAVMTDPPFVHCPPECVVHVRSTTSGSPYDEAEALSARLERFLLAVRMLTGATTQSGFEIRGSATRVSNMRPLMVPFLMGGLAETMIRRTAHLDARHEERIRGLLALLETSGGNRDGKLIASFDMSLRLFNRSHQHAPWFERLVDLSTALEGALVGQGDDNAGLSLRLRSRAAALLASRTDPASSIFGDIEILYGLRSKLVHGGDVKRRELTSKLQKLSTMPEREMAGVAAERAVDRLRDLVRRALLARIALGAGDAPLWPFDKSTSVDALLSDAAERERWRSRWRAVIEEVGESSAAEPARHAVDALSDEDRRPIG